MAWYSPIAFYARVYCPGVGYAEKKIHTESRYEFKVARQQAKAKHRMEQQRNIAIGQNFEHRGRFRGELAVLCMVCAVILWCSVFVIGKSISSAPFQQLLNIVSVKTVDPSSFTLENKNKPGRPFYSITHPEGLMRTAGWSVLVPSPETTLNVDRVSTFLEYFGCRSAWMQLMASFLICVFSFVYTNILLLSCFSATIGSLGNYAVQALRQAREFSRAKAQEVTQGIESVPSSVYGYRRVYSNLSATIVTGIGLGFAAFLACAAGLLLFPQLVQMGTPAAYVQTACTASLLAFVVALLPDKALRFIEKRVNIASQEAGSVSPAPDELQVRVRTEALRPTIDRQRQDHSATVNPNVPSS